MEKNEKLIFWETINTPEYRLCLIIFFSITCGFFLCASFITSAWYLFGVGLSLVFIILFSIVLIQELKK